MLLTFVEVVESTAVTDMEHKYKLEKRSINPAHVTSLSVNETMQRRLTEGRLSLGLDNRHEFTNLLLVSGREIVVVGSRESIEEQINKAKRVLHD